MAKSMKFLKSKFFIICLCVAIILVMIPSAMSILGYTEVVRSIFKTIATPFEWCGSKAADAVNGFTSVFSEYDRLKAENEELRATIESMENEKYDAEVIKEQNEWLKEYLNLSTENPDFVLTDASIISRESGNYATVLTLNKGSVNGIKKNMPVITSGGVFGYVKEVGINWCKVVSIVETASSVGAYVGRSGVLGVVEGDQLLRNDGVCKMTYIEADSDIKVGDRIYTSGTGKIYPGGLLIGTVASIEADEYSRTLVATISPAVNFSDISSINNVMIIKGYDTEDTES